jgi:hypothetical protein
MQLMFEYRTPVEAPTTFERLAKLGRTSRGVFKPIRITESAPGAEVGGGSRFRLSGRDRVASVSAVSWVDGEISLPGRSRSRRSRKPRRRVHRRSGDVVSIVP